MTMTHQRMLRIWALLVAIALVVYALLGSADRPALSFAQEPIRRVAGAVHYVLAGDRDAEPTP